MVGGRARDYEEARERIDRAVRPYVKVRIWKPEDLSLEDLEALRDDEDFSRHVSRLARLYLREKRGGGRRTLIIALVEVGGIDPAELEGILDDPRFGDGLSRLIREWAGSLE